MGGSSKGAFFIECLGTYYTMPLSLEKKQIGYVLIIIGLVLSLVLGFVKIQYDAQAAFLCENIEASGGDMLSCPVHKTDTSWFFVAGFGLSFVIILIGVYFGFVEIPAKGETRKAIVPIDVSSLDEESQKIYGLLVQRQGSLFQSDLVRETGYSKVRISRILDKMEHERIIERKRRGMTNLVVLV